MENWYIYITYFVQERAGRFGSKFQGYGTYNMEVSSQLQSYLNSLDGAEESNSSSRTSISRRPSVSSPTRFQLKDSWMANLAKCVSHAVDSMWLEELVWWGGSPSVAQQVGSSMRPYCLALAATAALFASMAMLQQSEASIWFRIVALFLVAAVAIPLVLGKLVQLLLVRLRAEVRQSDALSHRALLVVQKIGLTSLGRHLSHPLPPLGMIATDLSCQFPADSKALMMEALKELQQEMQRVWPASYAPPQRHDEDARTVAPTRRVRGATVMEVRALAREVLSNSVPRVVRSLLVFPESGSATPPTNSPYSQLVWQLLLLPWSLSCVLSALQRFKRFAMRVCTELDAALTTLPRDQHACTTMLPKEQQTKLRASYMELRSTLSSVRLRHEAMLYRLFLAEKELASPSMLSLLLAPGDLRTCPSASLDDKMQVIGRVRGLFEEADVREEVGAGLAGLAPSRQEYVLLSLQLASVEGQIDGKARRVDSHTEDRGESKSDVGEESATSSASSVPSLATPVGGSHDKALLYGDGYGGDSAPGEREVDFVQLRKTAVEVYAAVSSNVADAASRHPGMPSNRDDDGMLLTAAREAAHRDSVKSLVQELAISRSSLVASGLLRDDVDAGEDGGGGVGGRGGGPASADPSCPQPPSMFPTRMSTDFMRDLKSKLHVDGVTVIQQEVLFSD